MAELVVFAAGVAVRFPPPSFAFYVLNVNKEKLMPRRWSLVKPN